jgi:hypothetical protein
MNNHCPCLTVRSSKSDWENEAKQMAGIYQNAYLTIAATKSSGGDGGCFARDLETQVTGVHPDGRPFRASCFRSVFHWVPELGGVDTTTFPLLNRGWVYQERILSPRMLHFGSQELLWECMEMSVCECGGFQLGERPYSKHSYSIQQSAKATNSDLGGMWRRQVYEYSLLSLTYPSDKLPAFSGLAQREKLLRPQVPYLAGLWFDTLIRDLMWFSTFTSRPKMTTKRAPSWSWASLDGRIYFFDNPNIQGETGGSWKRPLARVLSAACVATGRDPHGEVSGGHINITGQMTKAVVRDKFPSVHLEIGSYRIPHGHTIVPANVFAFDCHFRDKDTPPAGSVVHLLQLAQIEASWRSEDRSFSDITGTRPFEISLLLKCVDADSKVFERVGLLGREGTLFSDDNDQEVIKII